MPNRGKAIRAGGAGILAVLALGVGVWRWSAPASPGPEVAVVDGDSSTPPVVMVRTVTPAAVRPPPAPLFAQAPAPLHALHDSIVAAPSSQDDAGVGRAFTANPALGASRVDVACSASRCEVHGLSARDDTAARLAMRDPAFLDTIEKAGYTAGMDMVTARDGRSEFVVYLDRR